MKISDETTTNFSDWLLGLIIAYVASVCFVAWWDCKTMDNDYLREIDEALEEYKRRREAKRLCSITEGCDPDIERLEDLIDSITESIRNRNYPTSN